MVTTFKIAPTPALAPYVRRYVCRDFDTNGLLVTKPWFASCEASLHFFFKALPLKLADHTTGEVLKTGKPCDILGMSSQYNGDMHFNGSYSFFQVIFTEGGFAQLFQIPSSYLVNQIIQDEDFLTQKLNTYTSGYMPLKGQWKWQPRLMCFLLSYLKRPKTINNQKRHQQLNTANCKESRACQYWHTGAKRKHEPTEF